MIAASIVQNGRGLTQRGCGHKIFVRVSRAIRYSAPQPSISSYAYDYELGSTLTIPECMYIYTEIPTAKIYYACTMKSHVTVWFVAS